MNNDNESKIEEPEKKVLDFLNYLEKETPIKCDISSLIGEFTWVTSTIEKITISMPAEFYTLNITNYPMEMVLRYCPCEHCHEIVYVKLIINDRDKDFINANIVMGYINKAVPDMTVHVIKKPKPLYIKNNPADFNY